MAADLAPLVSPEWLRDHLAEVRVVDVRWYLKPENGRTGRDAYAEGHLPGAVWLDVDADLSAPASMQAGRHPLPTPERCAAVLAAVGIAVGTPVVAYDDTGGSTAARLWWLLHVLDEPVAVLDGGLGGWLAAGGPLSTELPAFDAVERAPRPWPAGRFVDADELAAAGATVFDARSAERYAQGDPEIDPRPGHVPGALSAPWAGNLDDEGRFRRADELRERFAAANGRGAIAYCGSGVTACHNLLAMTVAGLGDLALYPGSWSQWGADPSRPAETGSPPR
jgi:thiosulfate/3-mercaptopyruvate sulfurtransferase